MWRGGRERGKGERKEREGREGTAPFINSWIRPC